MNAKRRFLRAIVVAALLLASASSAFAQLTRLSGPAEVFRGSFAKMDVAYDSVHKVYLVVWGTFNANPVMGLFLDKNGTPIGSLFGISDIPTEAACGYPRAVFGGPAGSETFLVTYTVLNNSTNPRRARLVKYNGGAPAIGALIEIANLYGGWPDSVVASPIWTGAHFLVPWRQADYPYDNSYVRGIDASGNYTTGIKMLTDQLDGEANPSIACDPGNGKCLATGFAWGMPFGTDAPGGTWSRFFDSTTLAHLSGLVYLDCPAGRPGCTSTLNGKGLREDQRVVFNTVTGVFQTVQVFARNYLDGQLVHVDQSLGPLEQLAGPNLGQLNLSFNPGTGTTVMTFKDWTYALAVPLDNAGHVVNPSQPLVVSSLADDLGSNDFNAVAAANAADGQWLIGYTSQYRSGRVEIVSKSGTPPPPPSPSLTVTGVSPSSGPQAGGTGIVITGSGFVAGATVTVGGAPATGVTVVSAQQIQAITPASGTASTVPVVVNAGGASASLAAGFTYVAPQLPTLTVTVVGNGTVTGGGIACPGTCSVAVSSGTKVSLVVTPTVGSAFAGWGGDADCGDGILVMTASKSCTVVFSPLTAKPAPAYLWRNETTGDNVVWYFSGGQLTGATQLWSVRDTNWKIAAVADFDRDGDMDVLWRNESTGQNVIWYLQNGMKVGDAVLPDQPGADWRIVGTGDFTGDGHVDLLWRNDKIGANIIWHLYGDVYIGFTYLWYVRDTNWEVVGVADFDGDGQSDILWRNKLNGSTVIWYIQQGVKVADSVITDTLSPDWQVAAVADFNHDGWPDVLWRNATTGANYLALMHNNVTVTPTPLMTVRDANWQIVAVTDYDGDGDMDLFWRNVATGENVIWSLNGGTFDRGIPVMRVSDLNWRLVAPLR